MLPENFNLIINLQIPQFEILLNFIPNPCQYDTTAATVRTIELIHICGLGASVGYEHISEYSTLATKVTYMDYFDYIVRLFVCFYTLPVWRIKFPNSSLRRSKPGVNLLR